MRVPRSLKKTHEFTKYRRRKKKTRRNVDAIADCGVSNNHGGTFVKVNIIESFIVFILRFGLVQNT